MESQATSRPMQSEAATTSLAKQLSDAVPTGLHGTFHPWKERCVRDADGNGPAERLKRLSAHLECEARWILVGEAPGYQGCRYSGIAFTSERLLLEGAIPRVGRPPARLSTRDKPFSEPSATVVWKALYRAGIAETTVLWNALQLHPFAPSDIWSNRTPTPRELELGAPALQMVVRAFPRARVIAVGKKAEHLLASAGVAVHASVRHPANGGATAFTEGVMMASKRE
jgi:uracil-DNA glycosylase